MRKQVILSIEDDEDLQAVIKHYLEEQGFRVLTALTAKEALERMKEAEISVVLLDLTLPDGDGLNIVAAIRERSSAYIIIVSGKDEPTDRIVGLEMGADDYITKPFEMRELYARVKAVLRRKKPENLTALDKTRESRRIRFDGWVLDKDRYDLLDQEGAPVGLTTAEFKLLEALTGSAHRVLSRDQLCDAVSGREYEAYDRAIDIHIARLRKKLEDDPRSPKLIKTVRGVGYMFCSDTTADI